MSTSITMQELRQKTRDLETILSTAINNFLKETGCDVDVNIYRHEAIGLRNVYLVSVKVTI